MNRSTGRGCRRPWLPALWLMAGLAVAGSRVAPAQTALDPARVAEVAAWLSEEPEGVGRPAAERAWWEPLRALPAFRSVVTAAEKWETLLPPEQPDELYLDYSQTGNRIRWQEVAFDRRGRLSRLVLAECLEYEGRFLPAIERLVAAICAEPTWVMPAHDGRLANFEGKVVEIDLASSALGWELATADWLLGDRLSAEARELIRTNVRKRVLDPFHAMATGERRPSWWMTGTNNWNAVCLAGVVGASLAQATDRQERAEFVTAAEVYSRNFLAGFTPDGYCSEGLGYWNYGFGNYVWLSETINRATGGRLNLLASPEAKMPALFGARISIIGGVSPAFADCAVNAKPSSATLALIARRLDLDLPPHDQLDLRRPSGSLAQTMLDVMAEADLPRQSGSGGEAAAELRTWFDAAGVLIGRPSPGSDSVLGVALKGGNNAEHHNHNDLGSFVVVLGDRPVLLDPGAETYTARTFSGKRYDSQLLNSYGHPVPIVAGQLQRTGREASARVLEATFTEAADTLVLDLTSAYPVDSLQKLERRFVYDRTGRGRLTVSDHVVFSSPQSFGTALLTTGIWQRRDDGSLHITDGPAEVEVRLDASPTPLAVTAETIREDAPIEPTRIGIDLAEPVQEATLILTIVPLAP